MNKIEPQTSLNNYIIDSSHTIQSVRPGGRNNTMKIVTFSDKSEYIVLNDHMKERFCGYLHLEAACKKQGLQYFRPAENKMYLNDSQVIYLSRYCGEETVSIFSLSQRALKELSTVTVEIGYTDTLGFSNMRKEGKHITIFDTAQNSFHKNVHKKINTFKKVHDAALKLLQGQIKE